MPRSFTRISGKPDDRAIAGLSMGGGQALSIGLHHLETFHEVGAFSAGIRSQNFDEQYKDLLADPGASNKKLKVFYIACGKTDSLFAASEALHTRWSSTRSSTRSRRPKKVTSGATGAVIWPTSSRNCSVEGV